MKILIVDLYGDGECVRLCEDTPRARDVIADYRKLDAAYGDGTGSEPPFYSDYLEQNGVRVFEAEEITL